MIRGQRMSETLTAAFTTAFGAGLITGIHCIGMCGPLTCALCPKSGRAFSSLAAYHACRTFSYTLAGVLLGLLGERVDFVFSGWPARVLPWVFVGLFVLIGLGAERFVPAPPAFRKLWARVVGWSARRPAAGGAALGLATPFLPCGPLYIAFGMAFATGVAWFGGLLMLAFALGTIAPLALAQGGLIRLRNALGSGKNGAVLVIAQRGLALLAAGVVGWRALAGEPFHPGDTEPACPMCPSSWKAHH